MTRVPRLLLLALLAFSPVAVAGCSAEAEPAARAAETRAQVRVVDTTEARALIDAGAQIIDVRTAEEFDAGHLTGAVNVDVQAADFHERVQGLEKSDSYVLYCRSGGRAGAAADMMLDMGFTDVVNAGGFDTLRTAGLPTE
ncbi:MAG: rhodanese-like domain-containing protein [Nocardioides sp.]